MDVNFTDLDGNVTTIDHTVAMRRHHNGEGRITPIVATPVQAVALTAAIDEGPAREEAIERRVAAAERSDWTTEIHADDKASADRDAAALKALGLTPGRTMFAPGTPLVRWGLDAWQAQRDALKDAPPVPEAAELIKARIYSENRRDLTVRLSDLRFDVKGEDLYLTRQSQGNRGGLRIERNALQALCTRAGKVLPGFGFVSTMTAAECADLWNSRVGRFTTSNDKAVIRFRNAPEGIEGYAAYAIVSPRYTSHDANRIADDLSSVFTNSTGQIVYDADRVALTWDIKNMKDMPPVVGEVYALFSRGRSRDDGTSSVWNGGGILRAICVNLTTEELAANRSRQVHRSRAMAWSVRQNMRNAAAALEAGFPGFVKRQTILMATDAASLFTTKTGTLGEAIAAMVDKRPSLRAAASGIKRDALVEALIQNARTETDPAGPGSLADVVNAVTRLHTQRIPIPVLRAIEADAGLLARSMAKQAAAL